MCVDSLSDDSTFEGLILRARALVRLGDANSAVESLDIHHFQNASHELAAEALAVKSYALQVLKAPTEAADVAIEARARCFSSGLVTIEAELLFACAIGSLLSADYASAESSALGILDLADDSPSWVTSKTYPFSLHYWRARACDILGVIASVRTDYEGHATWSLQAFEEYDRGGVRDDYSHGGLLANYADAAIITGAGSVIEFVLKRVETINWSPSLVSFEFRIFSALADAASATGDQISALRYFRRCLDCAPTPALQIRASVERARLLREIGESFSAREEIEHAIRLNKLVNWEDANALDQRQLLLLAAQVASFDGKIAESLMSRFDTLSRATVDLVVIKDERIRGEEFMARAAVMRGLGNNDRAILNLIDALDTFTSAKLHSKAAYAAAELASLTNESRYVEIALRQSASQPNSILARKMADFYLGEGQKESPDWRPVNSAGPNASVARLRPRLELLSFS